MTKRCTDCRNGYLEPPMRGEHFYKCDYCNAEVFVDDYSNTETADSLGRAMVAAMMFVSGTRKTSNQKDYDKLKNALTGKAFDYKAALIRGISFPGNIRKNWSSSQVTDWLNQQATNYDSAAKYDDDINHVVASVHRELASQFPSALRKMWSSLEIHQWLDHVADNTQVNFDKPNEIH